MTDLKLKSKSPEKLKEISDILCKSQDKYDNPGVLSGISGLTLAGGSKYADIGEDSLAKAIEMINNRHSLRIYCSGISGLAWMCERLARSTDLLTERIFPFSMIWSLICYQVWKEALIGESAMEGNRPCKTKFIVPLTRIGINILQINSLTIFNIVLT